MLFMAVKLFYLIIMPNIEKKNHRLRGTFSHIWWFAALKLRIVWTKYALSLYIFFFSRKSELKKHYYLNAFEMIESRLKLIKSINGKFSTLLIFYCKKINPLKNGFYYQRKIFFFIFNAFYFYKGIISWERDRSRAFHSKINWYHLEKFI